MVSENQNKFISSLSNTNVSYETLMKVEKYYNELLKWNKKINLISRYKSDLRIDFALAIELSLAIQENCIYDLGSGNGLIGVIIGILDNKRQIFLVEKDKNKCIFLRHIKHICGLQNVNILNTDISKMFFIANSAIVARALSSLDNLFSLIYYDNFSHQCYFLKGQNYQNEIDVAKNKWNFVYTILSFLSSKYHFIPSQENFNFNTISIKKLQKI